MIIGDWKVEVTKEIEFHTIPGNPNSPLEKLITYSFKYIPNDYTIIKTLHLIKPIPEEELNEILTEQTLVLKNAYINAA